MVIGREIQDNGERGRQPAAHSRPLICGFARLLLLPVGRRLSSVARISGILISLFLATSLLGSELTVDRRTVPLDDTVTIILRLEGEVAELASVDLPLKNLELVGEPSVSTEFSWINGSVSRRKTLRYTARPLEAGPALVGPLVLTAPGGAVERLAPVSLQVIPDEAAGSNDPVRILRELMATNRPLSFVVAQIDKTTVYEGEQVNVTWVLYNAANVQRWQIEGVPRMADFWSEENDLGETQPTQEYVGDVIMTKVLLRRVALFPLRPGRLLIGGPRVAAAVLRRNESPLGALFEGSVSEIRLRSAPVAINVRPLPPGPPIDIVGDLVIECGEPMQKAGGPVVFVVGLRGRANLRSAPAPHLDGDFEGHAEVETLSFNLKPQGNGAVAQRRWRLVVFPSRAGNLTIPSLSTRVFDPSTGQRGVLRCPARTIQVTPAAPSEKTAATPSPSLKKALISPAMIRIGLLALLIVVTAVVFTPAFKRMRRRRAVIRKLTETKTPAHIRVRVASLIHSRGIDFNALPTEPSERGDAYRALHSLLDAIERDRVDARQVEGDLNQRIRDLVQSLE